MLTKAVPKTAYFNGFEQDFFFSNSIQTVAPQ